MVRKRRAVFQKCNWTGLAIENDRVIEGIAFICAQRLVQQSLAADGAIACFSSGLVPRGLNADRAPQLKASVGLLPDWGTMIDSIVKIIDRLIDLLDRRKKAARSTFSDHIEPLFLDLSTIHNDYLSSLREISDLVDQSEFIGMELKAELSRRQQTFAPLRNKVIALASAIRSSDFDESAKEFAIAVLNYFELASETNSTGYATLLGLIEWFSCNPDAKRHADEAVSEVRANINNRWSELTQAYARVRLFLLSP